MLRIYGSFCCNLFVMETSRVVYNNIVVFVCSVFIVAQVNVSVYLQCLDPG